MSDQEFLHGAIYRSLLAVISKPHRGYWALLAPAWRGRCAASPASRRQRRSVTEIIACVMGGNRDHPPDAERAIVVLKSVFQYQPL